MLKVLWGHHPHCDTFGGTTQEKYLKQWMMLQSKLIIYTCMLCSVCLQVHDRGSSEAFVIKECMLRWFYPKVAS